MERRYLVAALAIVATFVGMTHGIHALQRLSIEHSQNFEAIAAARCWANSAAQHVAKVRAHFRHDYSPEQAQMVAEMNLSNMQSSIAEQMARQDRAISRSAREKALREAERARREAIRMQEETARAFAIATPGPEAYVNIPSDLSRHIQVQLAKNQMKLEMAQEKLADIEIPTSVDVDTQVSTDLVPNVKCKVKVSRQAIRDSIRGMQYQYGFTSK
jgi:hypothetical protein